MIDKDLIELEIFKKRFPCATVLYCRFHVLKTFNKECPKDKAYKSELLELLEKMVYAPSNAEFDSLYSKTNINLKIMEINHFYFYFHRRITRI